jgi:hypothetical protein
MKEKFMFISGFRFRHMKKLATTKMVFILTGIASTIWFILRVVPKPQRATYPCMRAAAPIMSSFIIWALAVLGISAGYKKAKSNFTKSRYIYSGLFGIAFVLSAILVFSQNAETIYARYFAPAPQALAPIGTGKGIFPGRVAWTYNNNAAKWTGSGNFWAAGVNNQSAYNLAFTAGIKFRWY